LQQVSPPKFDMHSSCLILGTVLLTWQFNYSWRLLLTSCFPELRRWSQCVLEHRYVPTRRDGLITH